VNFTNDAKVFNLFLAGVACCKGVRVYTADTVLVSQVSKETETKGMSRVETEDRAGARVRGRGDSEGRGGEETVRGEGGEGGEGARGRGARTGSSLLYLYLHQY
jgi:hypothetical protein